MTGLQRCALRQIHNGTAIQRRSTSRGETSTRCFMSNFHASRGRYNENPTMIVCRYNHHYSYGGASRPLFHYTPDQPRHQQLRRSLHPSTAQGSSSSLWILALGIAATGATLIYGLPSEGQYQKDKNHRDSIRQAAIEHARKNMIHNPPERHGPLKRSHHKEGVTKAPAEEAPRQ